MNFKLSTPTAIAAVAFSFLISACGTPPANLDLSLQHPSSQGKFLVRMEPPTTGPSINRKRQL
ncbi:hypothetical protein [Paraburkholderia terrae]|uniref:hypothetical protein n=1 Tax=Paraburkholderia terrae TaxID=311230 RepID=UPI001E2A41E9|nr:hypothetical protein [Paraburkholderia terrae]